MKKRTVKTPKEASQLNQTSEVKAPEAPGLPEDDIDREPKKKSRVSPYDFPPPAEGFFPEIF